MKLHVRQTREAERHIIKLGAWWRTHRGYYLPRMDQGDLVIVAVWNGMRGPIRMP